MLQRGFRGLGLAVGKRLLELAHVALAFGIVTRQAAGELAHEGLRQFVVVSARTGNLVVELAVVVGRGRDATHRELAQGLAGDFRGVAERGHGGGLFYRLGEIITAL